MKSISALSRICKVIVKAHGLSVCPMRVDQCIELSVCARALDAYHVLQSRQKWTGKYFCENKEGLLVNHSRIKGNGSNIIICNLIGKWKNRTIPLLNNFFFSYFYSIYFDLTCSAKVEQCHCF